MFNLEIVTFGEGAEHYQYDAWSQLMEAVNSLKDAFKDGIVSDITIWTEEN